MRNRIRNADEPIVWLVQNSTRVINGEEVSMFDTRAADKYGRRVEVVAADSRGRPVAGAISSARRAMLEYDAAKDYLILTGAQINIGIVFTLACDRAYQCGYDHVNTLVWQGQTGLYRVSPIPIRELVSVDWDDVAAEPV